MAGLDEPSPVVTSPVSRVSDWVPDGTRRAGGVGGRAEVMTSEGVLGVRAAEELEAAVESASAVFPFAGYISEQRDSIVNIARTVHKHVPAGGRILDFGCGPGDKTTVLAAMGYECTGCDDLSDPWHLSGDNRGTITRFLLSRGVDFRLTGADCELPAGVTSKRYDLVLLCDVLEHLHSSPRRLLVSLAGLLKNEGLLLITVPNAANLRKRFSLLAGKTNLPPFDQYYFHPEAQWRGHVREYVRDDLERMAKHLCMTIVELRSCHHMLRRLPILWRLPYRAGTLLCPGVRDTWVAVFQKPSGWRQPELAARASRHEWIESE